MAQSSYGAGFRLNASLAERARAAGSAVQESAQSTRALPRFRRAHSVPIPEEPQQGQDFSAVISPVRRAALRKKSSAHISYTPAEGEAPALVQESSVRLDREPPGEGVDGPVRCCTTRGVPGRAWLYPELPWGAPPNWQKTKMPGKTFLMYWDALTFVACLWVAIVVPYLAGFVDRPTWSSAAQDGAEAQQDSTATCVFLHFGKDRLRSTILVVDMLVDAIFWVDIVLNFHTAQWVICRDGRLHHRLIDELPNIRTMYLRGNFMVDLLGQIPWQYADCFGSGPELKMLRLFRMMKMLRLYRVDRSACACMPTCACC